MTVSQSQKAKPVDAPALRTGAEYLHSLRDGRHVYVDGELVKDVPSIRHFAGRPFTGLPV